MMMLLTILLIVSAVFLVIVILMQQGKGQEMGAVFGGSSQTIFGASGAGNFLTKATAVIAIIFMGSAFFISYISAKEQNPISIKSYIAKTAKPSLPPTASKQAKAVSNSAAE
ncbi:MAG: preprotein translocase subunit SecG [Deltaproteobacteria bacterium]|nr:preprotein translocase subunit SecG [Deltaproteobacteria bacterium]